MSGLKRANLELIKPIHGEDESGTLFHLLDRTVTAMGGRTLKYWLTHPLLEPARIARRQDAEKHAFRERAATATRIREVIAAQRLDIVFQPVLDPVMFPEHPLAAIRNALYVQGEIGAQDERVVRHMLFPLFTGWMVDLVGQNTDSTKNCSLSVISYSTSMLPVSRLGLRTRRTRVSGGR